MIESADVIQMSDVSGASKSRTSTFAFFYGRYASHFIARSSSACGEPSGNECRTTKLGSGFSACCIFGHIKNEKTAAMATAMTMMMIMRPVWLLFLVWSTVVVSFICRYILHNVWGIVFPTICSYASIFTSLSLEQ